MRCRLGFDEIKSASELCTAAAQGKVDLIKHYIKAGINVNAADYDKRTALHIAAADGCLEAVRRTATFPPPDLSTPGSTKGLLAQVTPILSAYGPQNVVLSSPCAGIPAPLLGKVGQISLRQAAH